MNSYSPDDAEEAAEIVKKMVKSNAKILSANPHLNVISIMPILCTMFTATLRLLLDDEDQFKQVLSYMLESIDRVTLKREQDG